MHGKLMSPPVISVIMSVRNSAAYVGEALDSVQAQSIENLQVIVIDDGSTDNTDEVARNHVVAAQVIRQEPLGISAALNRGMREVHGEFVSFVDADDVWPAQRLAKMRTALEQSASLAGVFGAMVNTDAQLRPLQPPLKARLPSVGLFRHATILKVGEFRTDVARFQNVDWMSRALSIGLEFAMIDSIVLFRRIHGNNLGLADSKRSNEDLLRVIRDHHARKARQ
jgi:glycosyltransferase involved in cell wall biosynthesis